jgi:hypothetical protein
MPPPAGAIFDPHSVAIVGNGRCASSCSLFSVTMKKEEGAKMVVVGGKSDVPQKYCGTIGGQSSSFMEIDTQVKVCGVVCGAGRSVVATRCSNEITVHRIEE